LDDMVVEVSLVMVRTLPSEANLRKETENKEAAW